MEISKTGFRIVSSFAYSLYSLLAGKDYMAILDHYNSQNSSCIQSYSSLSTTHLIHACHCSPPLYINLQPISASPPILVFSLHFLFQLSLAMMTILVCSLLKQQLDLILINFERFMLLTRYDDTIMITMNVKLLSIFSKYIFLKLTAISFSLTIFTKEMYKRSKHTE